MGIKLYSLVYKVLPTWREKKQGQDGYILDGLFLLAWKKTSYGAQNLKIDQKNKSLPVVPSFTWNLRAVWAGAIPLRQCLLKKLDEDKNKTTHILQNVSLKLIN